MKTVFSPQDVAHTFAHQTQDNARNSGNTLYFFGDSIYSYGRHFCIAKHVINPSGERGLLFTTRSYSNTTAKHISIVRGATNHLNVIFVYDPNNSPLLNLEHYFSTIKSLLKGSEETKHKGKKARLILEAEQELDIATKYVNFIGEGDLQPLQSLIDAAKSGDFGLLLIEEARKIAEIEAKRVKKAKAEHKRDVKKFQVGEKRVIYGRADGFDYLRVNKETQRIETSQGVEIPLAVAKRAFDWILNVIAVSGGCAGECGYKILDFEVKEVTRKYVVIGCHKIAAKEVNRIAEGQGWIVR